jgi:hypothetical protein
MDRAELKNMQDKWPKEVLKGHSVPVSSEWKKAMVVFFSLAMINIDLSKKTLNLSNQFSDAFDDSLKKETPIALNDETKRELQVVLRVKNIFVSGNDTILPQIPKLDSIVVKAKDEIKKESEDLWIYYIGAKANLVAVLEQSRKTADDIDKTLDICLKAEKEKGFDLKVFEAQTLQGIDTRGDIQKVIEGVYSSINLVI